MTGDLLGLVLEAHGGLARWRALKSISANFTLEGTLWRAKGQAGAVVNTTARADCHRQHITYTPFVSPSTRSVFENDRVIIETLDGRELQRREDARASFADHTRATQWDDLHLAYFAGYAMWNYLTTPFLFAMPGFHSEEIEPWQEDGETWRRLKVMFPSHIATHCPEQTFHFAADGLLRRVDYHSEVVGSVPVAHYVSQPTTINGIVVPHQRSALFRGPDGQANRAIGPAVAVAFTSVEVV